MAKEVMIKSNHNLSRVYIDLVNSYTCNRGDDDYEERQRPIVDMQIYE